MNKTYSNSDTGSNQEILRKKGLWTFFVEQRIMQILKHSKMIERALVTRRQHMAKMKQISKTSQTHHLIIESY